MLNALAKHINGVTAPKLCVVARWINTLPEEEKQAFSEVMANHENIHVAVLFGDLKRETELPFKLTAFRSHIRGYCTCQH